jgi:plastocyanin
MRRLSTAGLLLVLLALAGCGGSGSSSSTTSSAPAQPATTSSTAASTPASAASTGGAINLAADPSGALKFNTTSLTAKAGKVTVDFTNSSPLAHNVTIASSSGAVLGATPTFQGGTKSLTLNLKPGTYTFYCSVPGHRQAGMQGTLVVK